MKLVLLFAPTGNAKVQLVELEVPEKSISIKTILPTCLYRAMLTVGLPENPVGLGVNALYADPVFPGKPWGFIDLE